MKKKVRIYNPQYAKGGITQKDIQAYLMAQSQQAQQPQITEDSLVNSIYDELSLLGDKSGYIEQSTIDDLADKFQQTYGVDGDYILNLVNEVYSTLAPSEYKKDKITAMDGSPVPDYMGDEQGNDEQGDYEQDVEDDNLEANMATYDDYYGDDTDMSEMKFGGMTRKKFMRDFIKKAQEGMEQTEESIIGTNDTNDGREALVKGFESAMKKAVVKAVAKNQFEKNQQQPAYFEQGGFFNPTDIGDDEAYAHHLNLMAAGNKDIFSQPEIMMAELGGQRAGGMVMNPFTNAYGELQKFTSGGIDPSTPELDGTNLVDPSDPYTRTFAGGGTQEEYQDYIDWYNEDAPAEGMSKAAPQSFQEWNAENYPQATKPKPKPSSVPGYNSQNAMLAAQAMAQAMGYNMPSTPFGTLMQSVNPFSINRRMVQKGVPMIAGTNIPFEGMIGPNSKISEIYTDPRRFGKDAVHIKFAVPGQEGPLLGMDWQDQLAKSQNTEEVNAAKEQNKNELDKSTRSFRKDELDRYERSNVRDLEDESRVSIRAGERNVKGDIRRGLRQDPNAFYEGPVQEGMIAPMSDEEYMARVNANNAKAPTSTSKPISKSTEVETEKNESQYKSKRAALNAALDGVSRRDVKNLGKDYIGLDQINKNVQAQKELFDKLSNDRSVEGLEKSNKYAMDVVIPNLKKSKARLEDVKNYQANTSKKDKRKNFREFKKESRNKEEGGFVSNYMAYGGNVMYDNGGFVYNNPVDNRDNPVMGDKDFFSMNTNQNSIPDYLEFQSTPDQEVDVKYKQKNQLGLQPAGLTPFIGDTARNVRGMQEGVMMDKFNNQNAGNSGGREQADELISQGMFDINSGKEIISGFEGIVGGGKGVGQQYYSKFGGQLDFEEGGEYDLSEEEIQALIDAGVDLTLLEDYED